MINCPKCNATLPDWVQTCQFCHADTRSVARPVVASTKPAVVKKGWVWGAYHALAAYWMLNGLYSVWIGVYPLLHPAKNGLDGMFSIFSYVSIALGLVTFLVGLDLILHVELARGIVNFLAGMKIIFGLAALGGSVMGTAFSGIYGLLLSLSILVDIAAAAFMIYLVGETETRMPNL